MNRRLDFEEELAEVPPTAEEIQQMSRNKIVEAEKYKMALEPPKGMEFPDKPIIDDDEFMHMSCAVDDNYEDKIKSGGFLDMDKLLAKYMKWQNYPGEHDRLELINRGGVAEFRVADDRPIKITNVHLWEKAFRIYMAIYTKAHPNKAHEMVQYMHTIHHAASKYSWDNVAYYDVVFRQMMAKNPNRNWGKIYTQMWNIALCDPLRNTASLNGGWSGNNNKKNKGICWRFNKGICNYPQCRYPHRCSSCGGTNHGAHVCFKKNKKQGDNKSENKNNNNNGHGSGEGSSNTEPSNKNNSKN